MPDEAELPKEPENEPPEVAEWSDRLRPFLDSNPEARIDISDEGGPFIGDPWGDRSVVLELSEDIVDDLNSVRLFPEFSAIYHLDIGALECIYGPVPESLPYRSRRFQYEYASTTHICEFAPASERLQRIALRSRPSGQPIGPGLYRNLALIAPILRRAAADDLRDRDDPDAITSFWIREAPLDEEVLVELANHLNFYMWYYDHRTPKIVIHEQQEPRNLRSKPPAFKEFPTKIAGASLDPVLLGFWQAGQEAVDPARALLHYYRIFEYGAFYFIDQTIHGAARRVLKEPDALSNPDLTVSRLLDVLARENRDEHERLYRLLKVAVDPEDLWSEIEPLADRFTSKLEFDGGFELDPLLEEPTRQDFERRWDPAFAKSLRLMRNALVHGRERREVDVILPSARNYELIRPWQSPTALAAAQVMIFSD